MGKLIDMTGWIMSEHGVPDSRITVINRADNKGIHVMWNCKCSCGNNCILEGSKLRSGNTKSCGCINKELLIARNIASGEEIQIGDHFGKLTVIADLGMRKQKSRNKNWRWSLCQCDCGSNPIEVPNNLLKNGQKKSCGCICSIGEETIKKILNENNINYIQEYSFENLRNPKTNKLYRFDFAIFKENKLAYLIEFDGRQHYSGPESGWKQSRTLEEIQQVDNIKNQYCIDNGIILKRIPYFQLSQVNLENIESKKFNIN